jgi:hypothetical protein
MDHEIIFEVFIHPSVKSVQPAKIEPVVPQPNPPNTPYPHHQQEQGDNRQRTLIQEEELKYVNDDMFKSGCPSLDQEHRQGNNRSAGNSPTPSSTPHSCRHDQERQSQKQMKRRIYARYSAGESVTNRSQALATSVNNLQHGKAIWRHIRKDTREYHGTTDNYNSLKRLDSCAGKKVEESFDQQNRIRQAKCLAKRHDQD